MNVFISYRRKGDVDPVAGRIYERLEREFGANCVFQDTAENTFELGRDFRPRLQDAVALCDVLLVVIGPGWLGATDKSGQRRLDDPEDWVRIEIETALKRNIPVIPILVDGGPLPPRAKDLPPSLEGLAYCQGITVRSSDPDFGTDTKRLVEELLKIGRVSGPTEEAIKRFGYLSGRKRDSGDWFDRVYNSFEREFIRDEAQYNKRGIAWYKKQDYAKAVLAFSDAIRVNPKYATAYLNRGNVWYAQGFMADAIADYDEAIRVNPKEALAYANRGNVWHAKGQYAKAIADYNEAIRLDPKCAYANNVYAWIAATCPDGKYRDGKRAVELATRACELTNWKDASYLDTLAAACAEAGDFDAAVKWQTRARDLLPKDDEEGWEDCSSRVELYRARKRHREWPATVGVS